MAQTWQIEGKHFLVTGGASGLGAGKVEALLKEGAKAVVIFDINEDAGRSISDGYSKTYPGKVMFIKCDIGNHDALTLAFNQVLAKLKRIDVIINNAGILNDSPQQWPSSVDVNLKGLISLTWKGLSHMRKDVGGSGGTIVNVSSVAALMNLPSVPVYSATKSAVLHFGRCLSSGDFYETTGVRILTICYGTTDTPILNCIDRTYDERNRKILEHAIRSMPIQKVDSAVIGCIDMLKKGENGSIWCSQDDEAARDITPVIEAAYGKMCKELKL